MLSRDSGERRWDSTMANSLRARPNGYPYFFTPVARPDALSALSAQALALHRAGRLADAITAYQQILALQPGIPEVHNNLGLALAASGKLEEAVQAYRRAAKIKPDNPETLCN